LVPGREFGLSNCMEHFVGIGLRIRKIGAKMVPCRNLVILTYFGLDS
jgi:hypothetical protein